MPEVQRPDGFYASQQRFGMYRWHIPDPIRFRERIRVSVQALGFQRPVDDLVRYKPLRDDVASTAFWYQAEPHVPFTEDRSEEHTSELQSRGHLVCRLLLEKKNSKTAHLLHSALATTSC